MMTTTRLPSHERRGEESRWLVARTIVRVTLTTYRRTVAGWWGALGRVVAAESEEESSSTSSTSSYTSHGHASYYSRAEGYIVVTSQQQTSITEVSYTQDNAINSTNEC